MTRIVFLCFVCICFTSFSQEVTILNYNYSPISNAKVFSPNFKDTLYSNDQGIVDIQTCKDEFIVVEHKDFNGSNFYKSDCINGGCEIILDSLYQLKPLTVKFSKKRYRTKKLGLHKEGNIKITEIYFAERCILLKNSDSVRHASIKKISIPLRKTKKTTQTGLLLITFYTYDKNNDRPSSVINTDSIIIDVTNKPQTLDVDVSKYNIPFPEEGICIGFKIIPKKYEKKPIKTDVGPSYRGTKASDESYTWTRYKNGKWYKMKLSPFGIMFNLPVKIHVEYW